VTQETDRRPPGRPRRYAHGRINTTVRFTPARYEDLKASAIANGRSISEEVEFRIEHAAEDAIMREGYRQAWKRTDEKLDALTKQIGELLKGRTP
jgi:hypothetical protein